MKRGSIFFLKTVIVLIALAVLAGMIRFPQTEGRAANLDLVSIYTDPLIVYIYIGSIPFFVGLYQTFKLLNFIDKKDFSTSAVNALRYIKFSFLCLIGFIALALIYIRFQVAGEDPAGPTALGLLAIFTFAIISITAAVSERRLKNSLKIKKRKGIS